MRVKGTLTYTHKGTHNTLHRRKLEVCVFENNGTGFTSQLHQDRLQVLARCGGYDPSNGRTSCKVDFLYRRMLNQRGRHFSSVLRPMGKDIENPVGKTCFFENRSNDPVAARGKLGAFQYDGVTGRQGIRNRSEAKKVGGVPEIISIVG